MAIKSMYMYEGKSLKTVETNDNEKWFCGKDVCGIIDYVEYRHALCNHVDIIDRKQLSELLKNKVPYHEGIAAYINEKGLKQLIAKRNTIKSKTFLDWINKNILLKKVNEAITTFICDNQKGHNVKSDNIAFVRLDPCLNIENVCRTTGVLKDIQDTSYKIYSDKSNSIEYNDNKNCSEICPPCNGGVMFTNPDGPKNDLRLTMKYFENSVKVFGTIDEPWFCGNDVCVILGYQRADKAISKHVDNDSKINLASIASNYGSFRDGQAIYVNEAGLYQLIFACKLGIAKSFKQWICKEVLPSIRKTGSYSLSKQLREKDELLKKKEIETKELLRIKNVEDGKKSAELESVKIELERMKIINEEIKLEADKSEREKEIMKTLQIDILSPYLERPKNQIIYIATTESYAQRNRYKVGGSQSIEHLKQRKATYNTGRPQDDEMYLSLILYCVDFHDVEKRLEKVAGYRRDTKSKEMYIMPYHQLLKGLIAIIDHSNEDFDLFVQFLSETLKGDNSIIEGSGFVPEKLNLSNYLSNTSTVPATIILPTTILPDIINNTSEIDSNEIKSYDISIDWDKMNDNDKNDLIKRMMNEYIKSYDNNGIIMGRKLIEKYFIQHYGLKFKVRSLWTKMKTAVESMGYKIKY